MIGILLRKIAVSLDKRHIPYMVIGGQAVLLYGEPRLTKDIDITLGVDIEAVPAIESLRKELKLKSLLKNEKNFAAKTMVLPMQDPKTKIGIDFIFSFSPYEQAAIKMAKKVKIKGYPVAFASPEDLIIHKIFSGRAIDFIDVEKIIIRLGLKNINVAYIKKWLKEFQDVADEDLAEIFKRIVTETKR